MKLRECLRPPPTRARRLQALACAAALALLTGCAAEQMHREAMAAIAAGQVEPGLRQLQAAVAQQPNNPRFKLDLLNTQAALTRDLLARAEAARAAGDGIAARTLYQQALKVDPGLDRAFVGLAALEQDALIDRWLEQARAALKERRGEAAQELVVRALTLNATHAHAQQLKREVTLLLEQQAAEREQRAAAASIMRRPVTLQFRDTNLRMVFEALARTTGLNVVLDRDVKPDLRATLFVKDAAVEDVVDLILLQNQLDKKVLNGSTLFVYPATANKHKEYQDLLVRTFQISSGDPKHIQSVLKTMLKLKDVLIDERNSTLVLRDTADAIAVAAKVIAAHDIAEPEVMLEVEVLEVSRDRLSNIGIKFPEGVALSTPSDSNGQLTLGTLRQITRDSLLVSRLDAGVNFRLQDTDANLLSSPRLRARNKEKARVLIGDRVPIITNTVTPVTSGGSVVTGTVQYQEVGLKLDFEPQVYSEHEVGIRVTLEVSSITREIAGPSGSLAYQIGTRNASTALRLRDGETQVLAGLISDDERNTAAKLPGLGHLPMVGALFGNHSGSGSKKEIMLSITPRIIRPPAVASADTHEVYSGTEASIRARPLRLDSVGAAPGAGTGAMIAPPADGAALDNPFTSPTGIAMPAEGGAAAPAGGASAPGAGGPGGVTSSAAVPGANPGTGAPGTQPGAPGARTPPPATVPPPAPIDRRTLPPAIRPGGIYQPSAPPPRPVPLAPPARSPDGESAKAGEAPAAASILAAGELRISGPHQARIGNPFTAEVAAVDLPALKRWPLVLRYDPLVMRYVDAVPGPAALGAGASLRSALAQPLAGRIELTLEFPRPAAIASGEALVVLTFAAVSARAQTQLTVSAPDAKGEDDRPLRIARAAPLMLKTAP
jgi:general secretion pathway protein D